LILQCKKARMNIIRKCGYTEQRCDATKELTRSEVNITVIKKINYPILYRLHSIFLELCCY